MQQPTQDELLNFDFNQLITEDDTPVDNIASEKQQRLLTHCLYSSLKNRQFLAASNVGVFYSVFDPPIVPDVFVSFGVSVPDNWWEKANRSYFVGRFGKPPEVVIEIVSNKVGGELTKKLNIYAQVGCTYYIVYDPSQQLGKKSLYIYELSRGVYVEKQNTWLDQVELGVTLWPGEFEQKQDMWLRWCNREGGLYLTGDEATQLAEQKALESDQKALEAEQKALESDQKALEAEQKALESDQKALEAEQKALEAEQKALESDQKALEAQQYSQFLLERLRSLGIDPDSL